MNILDLLRSDGIDTKRVSSTRGGEYASSCPFCGGKDRFRSWPEERDGGTWWCRQCGKNGDVIQYLRDVRGLTFREACVEVGRDLPVRQHSPEWARGSPVKVDWKPRETTTPSSKWADKAASLVEWCQDQLWSEQGEEVVGWLQSERGLRDVSIAHWHLGWMPKDVFRDREDWGLPREVKDDGKPKKLWIPQGLVIPYISDEQVIKVKIRRPGMDADPRYYLLPGSSTAPMITGKARDYFIVVESELDALLLDQEAGDLATTVALGSAQMRPDRKTMGLLRSARATLISLDLDAAGGKQSWAWWMKRFDQAVRWAPIQGKDITDMWLAGVPLRAWVQAGLDEARDQIGL